MNFKKNILYSKKFIIFLFMMISYIVSYSTPISNIQEIKKETENNFIIENNNDSFNKYYIVISKNNSIIHFYEDKHENTFVSPKIKDIFIQKDFEEYFNIIFKNITHSFYLIATDITRSMRD